MKTYTVKQFSSRDAIDWNSHPAANVDFYGWTAGAGAYTPKVEARVAFVPGDGFYCNMICFEKNPRAVCRNFGDSVCCDSCLEFFASFDSEKMDYVNVEVNSIATAHIAIGEGRHGRVMVDRLLPDLPEVSAEISEDHWSVTTRLSLEDLKILFGVDPSVFRSGYSFRGNFYKCGDETEIEHYGMWNPCATLTPDFHRPEFFGLLVIE